MKILRKLFKTVEEQKFSYVTAFKDGYALAIPKPVDNKSFFIRISCINEKNEVIQETSFSYFSFDGKENVKWKNGYIIAVDESCKNKNNYVLLDMNLQKVKGYEYAFISFQMYEDSYILVVEDKAGIEYKGVLDETLNTVISTSYSSIEYLGNHLFATKRNKMDENTQIHNIKEKKEKEVNGNIKKIDVYLNKRYYKFCYLNKLGYYDEDFEIYIEPKYQKLGNIDQNGRIPFEKSGGSGVIHLITKDEIYR